MLNSFGKNCVLMPVLIDLPVCMAAFPIWRWFVFHEWMFGQKAVGFAHHLQRHQFMSFDIVTRTGNSFAAHLLYLSNECLVKQSQHAKRGYEWLDYSRSGTTQRRLINSPDNENNPLELRRCLMFNKLSLFATHKCLFGQKTNAARKGVYSVP